ncbi:MULTISPECIES: YggT family protein [Thiomicrorhabdus]|uniref:YggT family protein n=1 Tax=Thiomicrorhabdus heinhorstiae TaxID=2748010 RepID=A0ABS0BVF3_9GAMM|nr:MULTISPECIES: YggT family protein [Thiomicrorhabdus]MBF6057802.1 YggT family protein [Thiomicrorhabdus heinhorstiae]
MDTISPVGQGGLFLIQFITGLIIFALMLRFLMRATYTDWRHPIVKFIAKVTNPICAPLNKVVPIRSRWDWSALMTAIIIQSLFVVIIGWLTQREFGALFIFLTSISEIMNQLLDMMFWLIVIQAVLSWISQGYNPNTVIFDQMTQPILEPFRRLLPTVSGLDLSPILAIVAIKLVQIIVVGSIAHSAQSMIG